VRGRLVSASRNKEFLNDFIVECLVVNNQFTS
jgi:hypothetical protein